MTVITSYSIHYTKLYEELRRRGYEVRLVPSRDGGFRAEDFARLSDDGTRLIAVSAVQSATGYRADLRALVV